MLSVGCVRELQSNWFPHLSDSGLGRLIDLLQTGSPLLIHGRFNQAQSMGCLATHAAWHHPATCHLDEEAGIMWLTHVAGLNPATSLVLREWDLHSEQDWEFRNEMLAVFRAEQQARRNRVGESEPLLAQVS